MSGRDKAAVVAVLAVVLNGGALAEGLPSPLNVPLIPQTNFFWCWAASGSMVTTFYSRPIEQCRFVGDEISYSHCCDTGQHHDVCNVAGLPDFSRYHFAATMPTQIPLEWNAVVGEIGAGRPFVFTMRGAPVTTCSSCVGCRTCPTARCFWSTTRTVNSPRWPMTATRH